MLEPIDHSLGLPAVDLWDVGGRGHGPGYLGAADGGKAEQQGGQQAAAHGRSPEWSFV
jgi:hypothetical protein